MKKMAALVVMFMFTLGYATANSFEDPTSINGRIFDSSRLIGKTVKNFQGDDLGTIIKLYKGPEGRIAFAVLNCRTTDNVQKIIAIPIGALSCHDHGCIINASRETVETTPPFVSKSNLAHTTTAVNIYSYYGLQPYWNEEGTAGKR